MRVVAIKAGYFGQLREAGEEFEVPDGTKGSWFQPVQAAEPERKPRASKPKDDGSDLA